MEGELVAPLEVVRLGTPRLPTISIYATVATTFVFISLYTITYIRTGVLHFYSYSYYADVLIKTILLLVNYVL